MHPASFHDLHPNLDNSFVNSAEHVYWVPFLYRYHTGHQLCGGERVSHHCSLHRAMSAGDIHYWNNHANECKLSSSIHLPKEGCEIWKYIIREFDLVRVVQEGNRVTLLVVYIGVTQAQGVGTSCQVEGIALAKILWQKDTGWTQDYRGWTAETTEEAAEVGRGQTQQSLPGGVKKLRLILHPWVILGRGVQDQVCILKRSFWLQGEEQFGKSIGREKN